MENGTNGTTAELGNTTTNSRVRRVCFTLNNWTEVEYGTIVKNLNTSGCIGMVIGEEKGDLGTPHLQGYFELKNGRSFQSIKKMLGRSHIEKANGNREQNIAYCTKDQIKICTFKPPRKVRLLQKYNDITWRPWQQEVIDICETEPDNRTIYWAWEPVGNTGKSFLCKYLGLKYDAIIADGKKADIFNQIKTWLDIHPDEDPKIILLDVPRFNEGYVNYGVIEQIKNGAIYSGKYEGGVCYFEPPHIFIFSNSSPKMDNWSSDRVKFIRISDRFPHRPLIEYEAESN